MSGDQVLPCLLRVYRDDDEERALELVNSVFAGAFEVYEKKSLDWWRWKYRDNPSGQRSLVAEDHDGRLVAFYGSMLLDVRADEGVYAFAQSVDTVVDPAFRRGLRNPGLFVRIAQAYESTFAGMKKATVMYGLPIPRAYRVGSRYMDYWMLRAQAAMVLRDRSRMPGAGEGLESVEASEFPAAMDALATAARGGLELCGRRDAAWMNWRYSPRSGARYERRLVEDASGVLRAATVSTEAWFLGRKVVALIDLVAIPDDREAIGAALRPLDAKARSLGIDLVTLAPPTTRPGRALLDCGFFLEPTTYVMVARPFHPSLPPERLRDSWHYTLADLDVL